MQSTILATTVAVVAAKSAVTIPKFDHANIVSAASVKAKKGSSDSGQILSLAVDAKLKAEGINMRTTHFNDPGNFFEIAYIAGTDCGDDQTIAMVQGWQMGRCMNGIFHDSDMDGLGLEGKGKTLSYILSEPNNEGFPIVTHFYDHGCNPDHAVDIERMDRMDFGFSSDYVAGDCVPFFDTDLTTPIYMGKTAWKTERHEPHYNSVFEGIDTKQKACLKEKYFSYTFIHADEDICIEDGDGEYFSFDASTCHADKVFRHTYTDKTCVTPKDTPLTPLEVPKQDCLFDVENFGGDFTGTGVAGEEPYANFNYIARKCYYND